MEEVLKDTFILGNGPHPSKLNKKFIELDTKDSCTEEYRRYTPTNK